MIRLFCLFLFALPFLAQWEVFESEAGRFRVLSPEKMELKIDTANTEVGELIYHTFFAKSAALHGNQVYMISYCDYPAGSIHADSTDLAEEFFDATIHAAAESVEGEILYINKEKLQKKYRGKRWRIDYLGGNAVIRTRAFLVKNRYYSIQVVSTKDNVHSDTERFMDSFRVVE